MRRGSIRNLVMAALALFIISGFLLVDSSAQRRRKRRAPRPKPSAPKITNPAIYQPSPNENSNTSDESTTTENASPQPEKSPDTEDPEAMRKQIRSLLNQVDKLSDKIGQMEESQRSLVDLERLSRAEARSAQLRTELSQVQAKQGELEARAEDIDYAIKPENIERSVAGYGTTRPEELREQRRRQLETERERVRKQLDQLSATTQRLETAIAASDVEVDRLRKKLEAQDEAALQNAKTKEGASSTPRATPAPSPSPYPPQ